MVMGTGLPARTTVSATSSSVVARPTMRISDSWLLLSKKPPPVTMFDFSTAARSWSSVTSCRDRRSGEVSTWYCFISPPITLTCDTPVTASRRWRTSQSAIVRSSMGVVLPLACMPTSRISPMIEVIGAMTGWASSGNRSRTSWSFSETICRSI